jgi:hypothetical protein
MATCEHVFAPQSAGDPECQYCKIKKSQWEAQFMAPAPEIQERP